jgi:hypothetical protein
LLGAFVAMAISSPLAGSAATPAQQAYVKASNTGAGDHFGLAVAVSADTMVVGALFEASSATGINGNQSDNSTANAGAAYVFVRNGSSWTQQAYLKASNTRVDALFGSAVAVSPDTIIVGAGNEGSGVGGSGAVYIFTRTGSTWSQQAYLKSPSPGLFYNFGGAVGVSGDTVIVGEPGAEGAYIYVRSGTIWSQQAHLTASDAIGPIYFGYSVALSGDTAIVGAHGAEAAYVFVRNGTAWSQQARLQASSPETADFFGSSVAVSGDTSLVGAVYEDTDYRASGAAYIFARSGTNWSQQAHLLAPYRRSEAGFGHSVGLSGDTAVIGSVQEDSNSTGINGNETNNFAIDAGAAFVFVRSGSDWSLQAYLKASNTGAYDRFGEAVAISGGTVVVGAGYEDSNATGVNGTQNNNSVGEAGAAYVFTGLGFGPMLAFTADGSSGYFVRFAGHAGFNYRLLRATAVTGPWFSIATNTAPASGLVEFHDISPLPGQAFYRTLTP